MSKTSSGKKLEGKVSVITGSASGVGRATSRLFAKNGAKICVVDYDREGGKDTAEEINSFGGEAIFIETDVSKSIDVQRMINTIIKKYGQIDVLCNIAGIAFPDKKRKSILEITEEEWDRIIEVNLRGVFLCTKYAVPHMIKQGGVIINIASEVAKLGPPNMPAYTASKGGVYAFTKALAVDLCKYNIRVNSVSPGPLLTPMHTRRWQALGEEGEKMREVMLNRVSKRVILGRCGTPEEIANAILFLASDEASYVTGADFAIDGGSTAKL